jgi:hypothetical protein
VYSTGRKLKLKSAGIKYPAMMTTYLPRAKLYVFTNPGWNWGMVRLN